MCRGLAALGVNVTVYTTNADAHGGKLDVPVETPVNLGGVETWYFEPTLLYSNRFAWYSRSLSRFCRKTLKNFDLLSIGALWQWIGISASRAAVALKVPFIVSTHGSLDENLWRKGKLKKTLYWHLFLKKTFLDAAAVHFTTEFERCQSMHLCRGMPSFIVPLSVPVGDFRRDESAGRNFRRKWGIPRDAKVVLSIGRIDPKKRIDLAMRGIAPLMRRDSRICLVIAGPKRGGYAEELASLAEQLGISSRTVWTGGVYDDELKAAYSAADMFVLTSEGENMGMVVVEAMAMELPVLISNRVGVFPEVESCDAGCVVDLEVEQISRAFENMLRDSTRLREMGKRARACVERFFSVESVARRMLTAYEDVINGTRSPECKWS